MPSTTLSGFRMTRKDGKTEDKFMCSLCDFSTSLRSSLQKHSLWRHQNQIKERRTRIEFVCGTGSCSYVTTDRRDFRRHSEMIHQRRPHSQRKYQRLDLRSHLRRRRFHCDCCPKPVRFIKLMWLLKHEDNIRKHLYVRAPGGRRVLKSKYDFNSNINKQIKKERLNQSRIELRKSMFREVTIKEEMVEEEADTNLPTNLVVTIFNE